MKLCVYSLHFCITFLLFSSFIQAQIPSEVTQEIDQRIKHQLNPSIVIGVYSNGQSNFYSQGFQNKELHILATSDSVYEIGSITKTYTGLLLAQMITEQKLTLDAAVQDH